jgi:cytochrome c oxidase subunit 2
MRGPLRIETLIAVAGIAVLVFSCPGCERKPGSEEATESSEELFESNGEQIYFTGTSRSGLPIAATGGMMMHGHYWFCADCHGKDGRGGEVRMMMHSFTAPDVRYKSLTSIHHHEEEAEHEDEHQPYTDETIKQAITSGVDPAGKPLDPFMPRWSMSDEDLEDLLDYLKNLK